MTTVRKMTEEERRYHLNSIKWCFPNATLDECPNWIAENEHGSRGWGKTKQEAVDNVGSNDVEAVKCQD